MRFCIIRSMTAALLAFLVAAPLAAQEQAWDARITEVKGEATFYEAGGGAEGVPAAADIPLQEGDRLHTGADGSAEIALDGEHVLSLRSNSDFTLSSARKADTRLTLGFGSLLAKFSKLLEGQRARVQTPTAVAAVRGTEFAVEHEGEETYVGVFDEGSVEVSSADDGKSEVLQTNQETKVRRGERPMPPYVLRRLMRHRALMRNTLKRRPAALRRAWRQLPAGERQALRRQILQKRLEFRRQRVDELRRRQNGARPAPRQPFRDERIERRKREIMERRRRQSP